MLHPQPTVVTGSWNVSELPAVTTSQRGGFSESRGLECSKHTACGSKPGSYRFSEDQTKGERAWSCSSAARLDLES